MEDGEGTAGVELGVAHGEVGLADEGERVAAVGGTEAEAEAGGDGGAVFDNGVEDVAGGLFGRGVAGDDDELVTADAGEEVAAVYAGADAVGGLLEEEVADAVAVKVIDLAEFVEAEEEDGDGFVIFSEEFGERGFEAEPVGEVSEGVVLLLEFQVVCVGEGQANDDEKAQGEGACERPDEGRGLDSHGGFLQYLLFRESGAGARSHWITGGRYRRLALLGGAGLEKKAFEVKLARKFWE
jgi:hypothetical protein